MTKDLSYLPLWYADTDDLVYVENADHVFLESYPKELAKRPSLFNSAKEYTEEYNATPWGISPHILHYLKTAVRGKAIKLDIPEWNTGYKTLTSRQSTIKCHQLLNEQLPELHLPFAPEQAESVEAIESLMAEKELPIVLKAPFSSSGRGVLWIREPQLTRSEQNWIKGVIQKQGFISLEKGLNKTMDFAMEFYSDGKGEVRYEGLSLFNTGEKGAYTGNRLAAQTVLEEKITSVIGKEELKKVCRAVTETLQTVYSHTYKGYLGVDMILYEQNNQNRIHPCIEVNMRFTMGLVALRLFEYYLHPEADGNFYVTFDKEPGAALKQHLALEKNYPLIIREQRIRQGYLSLCPVSEHTNYRVYLIV
jgi:RimK-like ATP-grasp domain.